MVLIRVLLFPALFTIAASSEHRTPPATHWTVVVCASVASQVTLQAGPGRDDNDVFATWHAADAHKVFALPDRVQGLTKIYFQASTPEGDKQRQTYLCVKYDGVPKKWMQFDKNENHDIQAGDSESSCTC